MPSLQGANENKRKLNKTASASVWYIGSNLLSRGVSFLFTPLFTRLLSPAEYGLYSLYVSLMGIFTVLTTFQMSGNVIYRGFARFDDEGRAKFLSCALGALCLTSGASLVVFSLFGERISNVISIDTPLTLILIFQIFLTGVEGFYLALCRYDGNYRTAAKINVGIGVATPILSLLLIRFGFRGYSRILSPLFISLTVAIPAAVKIIREGRSLIWREGWRFIFGMSLPMLPHFIAVSLIAQSDKIIIARILGEDALGKYGAAYSIGFILSHLASAFSVALSPWIIKKMKEGKREDVKAAVISTAKVIGYATLLFLAILPELFRAAVAAEYREALPVAYFTSLSVIFSFLSSVMSVCILHYEKPMLITRNSLIAALPTVIISWLLVWRIGYVGGAVASLSAYALLFLLNKHTLDKREENTIKVKFGLHLVSFFVFSALLFFLRASFLARLMIALATVLLALPEVKSCKRLLF